MPIMAKMYQGGGGAGMGGRPDMDMGGMHGAASSDSGAGSSKGPTVEEVD